ncbi:LCP family protein [Oceanobacillus bengalensis]|uniref:LytR family transcriptional regulator n=1 Tax=Oceanobacillus bengalensis TaxID=1435466 RepID=A0A494YZW4_9BACI|nr:LCP family protein [Oceanobacillus bengalensis]RKQ15720.1 LytR family transcriptional regulator [Oceanobacillus bengalensis]
MSKDKTNHSRLVKTKKRKLRKRVYLILIPLVIAFVGILSYASYLYIKADSVLSESYEDDGREKSELRQTVVDPTEDNVSVLIMGIDASDVRKNADNSRTDTLMVATLNKKENSVKLVSIPRDSLVYIPELGYEDKINHAHAFGGTKLTIETVENLLEIPIDYYVKLNFEAFIDVVDAVGGITVDVPYEFTEQNSKDKAGAIHLLAGEQQLNGEEALALARTRKLDSDIERGKRQQEIIKAVVAKSVSVNSLLNIDDVIEAVGSNMTTNMTFSEMKSFVSYGTSGKNLDFETITLEGENYRPGSIYYWKLNELVLSETKSTLQDHLDLTETTTVGSPTTETTSESIPY